MAPSESTSRNYLSTRSWRGFLSVYGWLGIPMIVAFMVSAAWTMSLVLIQHDPTFVANTLMRTADLDDGAFWQLRAEDNSIAIPAIFALAAVSIGYLGLVLLMLFPDKLIGKQQPRVTLGQRTKRIVRSLSVRWNNRVQSMTKVHTIMATTHTASSLSSRVMSKLPRVDMRLLDNPVVAVPKLVFQSTILITYLHDGFPATVVGSYSLLLFVNWTIGAYRCWKVNDMDPHLVAARVAYSFDLFFAVFAPLQVLMYSYWAFEFDRDVFATRVATLSKGSYDRTARLYADPTQVSSFRIAYQYLQFSSWQTLLIRCCLHVFSLFRWKATIELLVWRARAASHSEHQEPQQSPSSSHLTPVTSSRMPWLTRHVVLACCIFSLGAIVFAYSIVAWYSTVEVCRRFEYCKVPRYEWSVGASTCPCIVFVNRDTGIKTFAEWENPVDTTSELAALAAPGHLKVVQIINRQLATLPDELRWCRDLRQLTLIYSKTTSIPDWAKELTRLEHLHIEGDFTSKQLSDLPHDLFQHMPSLMFLHLGCLMKLQTIPDLSKLHKLQYLVMAVMHSVTEIPPLKNLKSLQHLKIIDMVQVYSLPSTRALTKLDTFALTSRSPVCCNGFINGTCDLTDFSCLDRTAVGEPLVKCADARIATDDYTKLVETDGIVCEKNLTFDLKNVKPTLVNTDASCAGVSYKQCTLSGKAGMCYPARMQPVSCQLNVNYQRMRRLEIERGVGDPCDPAVENWLGCQA